MKNIQKSAFTLAEVLITLGVIGVVAAITMPILITSMTERKNSERHANIAYKITQAMEHMRATGTLVQYDSTESFVNELKKHLKIAKICDKDHLTECWPTETVTNKAGEEYNVADAKTGKELGLESETNNVGLILGDGAVLILNYNPALTQGLDVGDRVEASTKDLPVGNGKMKEFAYTSTVTGPIDFVMDVNGIGKPNREKDSATNKEYDIRSFNGASFSKAMECGNAGCIILVGGSYDPVDCTNSANSEICGPHPSGYSSDLWAGAKAKCNSYTGFHLPTLSELLTIQGKKSQYPSLASNTGWFWSADEESNSPQSQASFVVFHNSYKDMTFSVSKGNQGQVVCLGNP